MRHLIHVVGWKHVDQFDHRCWDVFCRLVSGAGDIKLTKDGNVLLHEMVRSFIQHTDGY